MSKVFDFREKLTGGQSWEDWFQQKFSKYFQRTDGRNGDHLCVVDNGIWEQKSEESYAAIDAVEGLRLSKNFFIERFSVNLNPASPGGPWQALQKGCKVYFHLYADKQLYIFPDIPALIQRLEKMVEEYDLLLKEGDGPQQLYGVDNGEYVTYGWRINREKLADLYHHIDLNQPDCEQKLATLMGWEKETPQPASIKRSMKIKQENIGSDVLTKKVKKPKKAKEPRDIRSMFRKVLKEVELENLKKPWMAQKAFRLINTIEELEAWVDSVLNDETRYFEFAHERCPVVAVDTETIGLDTRILVDLEQQPDGSWMPVYEVKIELAGICLSSDGIEGIYIPVTHEKQDKELTIPAVNIDRVAAARALQRLFNRSHLIFYNAKFDREVLRLTMGIDFRPYPHFEDVQVLAYLNDPKADLGDKGKFTGESGGLKALSKNVLDIEQIELEEIGKVKADFFDKEKYIGLKADPANQDWTEDQFTRKATTQRVQYVPFSWIPTDIALWYAAGDAICTWLLWKRMYELARSRKLIHKIDHELVDSITWIERQRFLIDVERLNRTVKGHQKKIAGLRETLRQLAIEAGYEERQTDEGVVLEDDKFNPGSTKQLQDLLFKVKKFKVSKYTTAGNASCDAEVLEDLHKEHPDDEFLKTILTYRDYMALHPDNLRFDPKDHTARIYLKQNVVAGGRLAAAGGEFERDGGFGLNPQGIKKVEGHLMWKVSGNVLDPDPEEIPDEDIQEYTEDDLHPSCFKDVEQEVIVGYREETRLVKPTDELQADWEDDRPPVAVVEKIPIKEKQKVRKKAPGIVKNHIGKYMGYAICLVPNCTSCKEKYGHLIENTKMDANEVINLRVLFYAPPGWTLFSVDYSNIEMRCAANVSGEPEFIKEFLEGAGDCHALTASKVFPEFTDPNTPKAVRKSYRDLAKIINFALLYGGTEYTIFENMKKKKPDITWDEAKSMVEKYWAGVPVFAEFCQMKQAVAREQMLCKTATGRVINFKSAMEAQHIRKPTDDEKSAYWEYRDYQKKHEMFKKTDPEKAAKFKGMADRMWKDPETGVRNYMDYNKFMGKIQRVSVNVPLQGLAGDFMRMSLNRIRRWVESDPLVQQVFHLHCSVHDEIDFIIKNEYVPFILPRITRLMKLRKMHEKMNWKVPIESDAEYGRSWDVEHHVTGDADHEPAAWTEIKEVANYIPEGWDIPTLKNLLKAIGSGEETRVNRAVEFLKANLHERAFTVVKHILEAKDDKTRKKFLIAALQLDEYWKIDNTPDDEDDKLEKLEDYERRNNLGPGNRDPKTPAFGYLGAVPLDAKIIRPTVEILGEAVPVDQLDITVSTETITVAEVEPEEPEDEPEDIEGEKPLSPAAQALAKAAEAIAEAAQSLDKVAQAQTEPEEDVFATPPAPAVKQVVEVATAAAPAVAKVEEAPDDGLPLYELTDYLATPDMLKLRTLLGTGDKTIKVRYQGAVMYFRNKRLDYIPNEYLKQPVSQ